MQPIFNPIQDAQIIKHAFSSPVNIDTVIQIITHRSNQQRQEIKNSYFNQFQINIFDEFNKHLSGKLKYAFIALFCPPVDYDCYEIQKAVSGLGTDEDTLIEIIASRSNERLIQIRQRFPQLYKKDVIEVIRSETSGHLQKILISLLQADRPCNIIPNEGLCKESAIRLYDSLKGGKDMAYNSFIYVFTEKSREELAMISKIYYTHYFKTLMQVVEDVFSGDGRRVLKAIIYSLLSPSEYFAYRINKALTSFILNDTILTRVLVSRDEIDMDRIKKYYKQNYNISLYDQISNKTSGDYKKLLLSLIGN